RGALTIVALTSFLYAWEDYLWPLLVLRTGDNFTMMLELARLQSAFGFDYRVVLAGAIVALVPVTVMFFFTQKFFFRDIVEGGLKVSPRPGRAPGAAPAHGDGAPAPATYPPHPPPRRRGEIGRQ